ncbi:MAG: hypothetical protein J6Y42_00590 [Bacilli bacterium]|nr:hypothetical protein [Bacilli bacterium]
MKYKNTAEKYYGFSLVIISTATFFSLFMMLPLFYLDGVEGNAWGTYLSFCIIYMLVFGSILAYYIYQYVYYKRVKLTEVQNVKLEGTDTWFRNVAFKMKVKVGIFEEVKEVSTKHVFLVGEISVNKVDDFSGKIAKVGYNKQRDEWIVIDVVKEEENTL